MNSRNVLLAVTGSIAAYKAAQLASELTQRDLAVRVILTRGGSRFIMPVTFEGITGNPVAESLWDDHTVPSRLEHLDLAAWADILVVAPASADAIARLAHGLSDDLLGATALAYRGPFMLAPAMETHMFNHPATVSNLQLLEERGASIVGPESGRLASGATGPGRMSEPSTVARAVLESLRISASLEGKRVLVSAGPTYEPIDPVRFIGNRSSGKMGYAVATEAQRRGGDVTLVSGPASLASPHGVVRIEVETSDEMRDALLSHAAGQDVIVMCAAVSDYKPVNRSPEKLKRGAIHHVDIVPTEDIAAAISKAAPAAIHVGFALESGPLVPAAREKMTRKGQKLVVANSISPGHDPFGSDDNEVVFVMESGERFIPRTSKAEVARLLWDQVVALLAEK